MLLGFKKQFALKIKIGTKVHTIRGRRKVLPKIGEVLHMYTALRTKHCELISNKETLQSTQKVWVKIVFRLRPFLIYDVKICVDGRKLNAKEMHLFCQFDGFEHFEEFAKFWIEGYRKDINKKGAQSDIIKIVESKTLYHWTDLKY